MTTYFLWEWTLDLTSLAVYKEDERTTLLWVQYRRKACSKQGESKGTEVEACFICPRDSPWLWILLFNPWFCQVFQFTIDSCGFNNFKYSGLHFFIALNNTLFRTLFWSVDIHLFLLGYEIMKISDVILFLIVVGKTL